MQINGRYIEEAVEGYRTLYVKGRELLEHEITTQQTSARDGSVFQYRRCPDRTLTVGYQLVAATPEAFRAAYNRLNALLDVQEAQLIFADEPDLFFVGTPSGVEEVPAGRCAVTGQFHIYCADPFKYSVTQYEAVPSEEDGTAFRVDYQGSCRSYPILEAEFAATTDANGEAAGSGDCGYVAWVNQQGRIIQVGDPDEMDTEGLPKSQALFDSHFTVYNSVTQSRWPLNVGQTSSDSVTQAGTVAITTDLTAQKTRLIHPGSYGTGSKYHGPSLTRTIPADRSGHAGAANFRFSWQQRMSTGPSSGDSKQRGLFQVLLHSGSGSVKKTVAGISILKSKTGTTGVLRYYVNSKIVGEQEINLSYLNFRFGYGAEELPASTIQKAGNTITFRIGGIERAYRDNSITETEVHSVTIAFAQYGTVPALTHNGLYWAKFIKDNCDEWRDVPNKFTAGDTLTVDCGAGEILLNAAPAPELGALGNDWEQFYLTPGVNAIGVAWSGWVPEEDKPAFGIGRYFCDGILCRAGYDGIGPGIHPSASGILHSGRP